MKVPVAAAACTAAFLLLDATWLGLAGPRLYQPAIGHLMRPDVQWGAAALFYLVYIAGLMAFAIVPATGARNAARRGACFGLVAYATYDLTCQATMKDWPWLITVVDLAWGTFASAVACAVAAAVALRQRR